MIKRVLTFLCLSLAFVAVASVCLPLAASAQETTAVVVQASPVWRVIQLASFVLLILSLAGMTYGIVMWRNGSQNNDVLMHERGRRLTLVFGILLIIFAVLLMISFLVIRRQTSQQEAGPAPILPAVQGGLDTRDALLLIDALPVSQVPIRNVAVQMLFNQDVAVSAIEQNVAIRRRGDAAATPGTWTIRGAHATFVPNQTCPSPHTGLRCFDADTPYEILIANTLTSADGDAFRCSIPSDVCRLEFTTGSLIDVLPPQAQMAVPVDGAAVPSESVVLVEALGKDDIAVAVVEFSANGNVVGTVIASGESLQTDYRASSTWSTEGLALLSRHDLTATVYDLAGYSTVSLPVNVEIRQAYCFDGQQNEDETALDCGGPSCRSCQGLACTQNSDCASGLCVGGVCRAYPIIDEVIESNGAIGNLVTLRGRNFGATQGSVVFLGLPSDDDDTDATFPACDAVWSDTQVIVRVPANAKTGPLRLLTSDQLYDTTDDDKGGRVVFEVNDRRRPGLCAVSPNRQTVGESVGLSGEQFGTTASDVSFGQVKAGRIVSWADASIQGVTIPSIPATQTPVRVFVGGEKSNPVFMQVVESPTLPRLESISPDRGPVGQIFSIHGVNLSNAPLVKFVNPRTGEVTLADTRLPDACTRVKKNNLRAFRVPRLENGIYDVFVETSAGRSNNLAFTVTASGRLPGLCAMEPDNGPLGLETVLYGEGFGVNDGQVRFHARVDNAQILSWSDSTVRAIVPPSAQTGPVQVISERGDLSNSLMFTIGQCSPDTCGTGTECCADGACRVAGTCSLSVPACTYTWTFSTGDDLGGIPRVIETATCKNNTQSPSPFNGTIDACSNAAISARFTLDMDNTSLSANNVELRRCNTGSSLNTGACQTTVSLGSFDVLNDGQPGEGFMAVPQQPFESDTWYQVTLSVGIKAQNGNALAQPYRWAFKTQQGDGICSVDHVEVTPAESTIREIGKSQKYTGVATALNCNLLNAASYKWSWLSSDTAKAVVDTSNTSTTKATAKGPTQPGPAIDIYGSIPEFSKEDSGKLTVALEAPLVVDKWPNCSGACINAALGAKFNQRMDKASVTSAANFELVECRDEACARATATNVGVTGMEYNDVSFTVHFLPNVASFKAATKYRVILKNIRAASGLPLAGLNYDSNGDGKSDSYSWLFSTGTDANVCKVERVQVDPPLAQSFLILEDFNYQSLPVSKADACSATGQILRGDSYDWTWSSGNESIGRVTQSDVLPLQGFKDWAQITTSTGSGETKIRAQTQGVTGEGDFNVSCGYERDNQCPSPATPSTYGVGNDSCCWPRPKIAGTNPREGARDVCTTLAVEVQFDQRMEQSSVLGNIVMEVNNGSQACAATQTLGFMQSLRSIASAVWNWVVPSAGAQATNWCPIPATVSASVNEQGTLARITPQAKLIDDRQYRVRVTGDLTLADNAPQGVRNSSNVPMSGEVVRTFTTGKAECSIDILQIEVTPPGEPASFDVAFCAVRNDCRGDTNAGQEGNQHTYKAVARERNGFVVPATFTWTADNTDLISLSAAEGDEVEMTPKGENGDTSVTVKATALAPSKGNISRTLDVIVFICENPWPSILDFPYVDKNYNYDIFYCRDAGEEGTGDDLPPLSAPVTGSNIGGVLRESIFIVE